MVGLVRFELTTSCTPCKRATRLRYSPMICGRAKKPDAPALGKPFPWLNSIQELSPRNTPKTRKAGSGQQDGFPLHSVLVQRFGPFRVIRVFRGDSALARFRVSPPSFRSRGTTARHFSFRCGKKSGVPGVTRTRDRRFRKPMLYPAELRGQNAGPFTGGSWPGLQHFFRDGAGWFTQPPQRP